MTFLENKFRSLCRQQGHRNKKGGIKAVLRLSLGWNGKHPLLVLCLMCFHLSLCFYSSWPPQEPSCNLSLSHLPLSVFKVRPLPVPIESSPSHYFLIPISLLLLSRHLHTLTFSLYVPLPTPLTISNTCSYLLSLAPYPLTVTMELTLRK